MKKEKINTIPIKKIPYGKLIKYKDISDIFGLPYLKAQYIVNQINAIKRYYEIEKQGRFYKFIREYSKEEVELNMPYPLDKNFKIDRLNMHKSGVYIIQLNNTVYIGQTNDFLDRYNRHKNNYNKTELKTQELLQEGATFSIICFEELLSARLEREEYYINKYIDDGYFVINVLNRNDNKYKKKIVKKCTIYIKNSDLSKVVKLLEDNNIEFSTNKNKKETN